MGTANTLGNELRFDLGSDLWGNQRGEEEDNAFLLLETGGYLLLETGGRIILE